MYAFLLRKEVTKQYIRSDLHIGGQIFCVIERPWNDNRRNNSCIPVGTYKVTCLERSASGKYRDCFHVHDVENRSGILIHNGNLASHSRGCLILGMRRGTLGGKIAVLNSKTAMRKLNQIVNGASFTLQILGNQVVR